MAHDRHTQTRMAWLEQVQDDPEVSASAFAVAFAIVRHLNRRTGEAWPGRDALAAMAHLKARQVTSLLQLLQARGHVEVRRRPNSSSVYRLKTDVQPSALPDVQPPAQPRAPDVQSAAPRKCNPVHRRMCNGLPPNPLNEPLDRTQRDISLFGELPVADRAAEDFAAFWRAYPKKAGKPAAEKAWRKKVAAGVPAAVILAGAERYAAERQDQDPKFTKHPSGWLNDERWADDPTRSEPASPRPSPNQRPSALDWAIRSIHDEQ